MSFDAAEALGKALGIAMVATGADLCAAGNGVPGAVGPLDGAFVRHESPLRNQNYTEHKYSIFSAKCQGGEWVSVGGNTETPEILFIHVDKFECYNDIEEL